MERISTILHYWFGNAEKTTFPSDHRQWIWFSADPSLDLEVKTQFEEDLFHAIQGHYAHWENTHRGILALIILWDQFSRHIYRNKPMAFAQDDQALKLCLLGIDRAYDHRLSLMERIFFYFPLMHAENIEMQILSVRAYQMLAMIAFPETKSLFERFLESAIHAHDQIRQFGRFPDRNEILGRASTKSELIFLNNQKNTPLSPFHWNDYTPSN